jgi:hypothetical protein
MSVGLVRSQRPAGTDIPMVPCPSPTTTAAQHTSGRYCSCSVNIPTRPATASSWLSCSASVMVLGVNFRRPISFRYERRSRGGMAHSSALPSAVAWAPSSQPTTRSSRWGECGPSTRSVSTMWPSITWAK